MSKKSRKAIARVMAVLMAFTLLPFHLMGTADVVMAEERSEAYEEESAGVESDTEFEDDISDATSEESESESSKADAADLENEESDSVAASDTIIEETKTSEETGDSAEELKSADTTGYSLNREKTWTFDAEFWKANGNYTNNGTISAGKTFDGIKVESDTVRRKPTETPSTMTLDGGKVSLPVANDTDAVEITITLKSADEGKYFNIGDGANKKKVMHSDFVNLTFTNETLYLRDAMFPNDKLYIEGGGGESKIVSITLKEYRDDNTDVSTIDKPTASPVSGTELNRKSTIELKAADGATIYYTTNGDAPDKDKAADAGASTKTYTAPIAVADLTDNGNRIIIKAIAVTEKGTSEAAIFEYTYNPDAVAVVIDDASKEIIKSAEAVGNVSDVNIGSATRKVTDIMVKAQELQETEVADDIKAKAQELVSDADKSNIKYYNLSLLLNEAAEAETDTVTFTNADAALKLKMPYSIFKTDALGDVTEENEIFILHNAEQIDAGKIKPETVTSQNAADAGFWFEANSFSPYTVVVNPAPEKNLGTVKITDSDGYEEGVYAKWEAYSGANGYKAYMATEKDGEFVRIDNELIREYKDYWRVDAVGLAAGDTYYLKVEAVKVKTEGDAENVEVLADKVAGPLTVANYDRSGFAFSSQSPLKSGSGAYKDNGELKDGAQVIYVTKDTAKTCKAMIHSNGTNKPAVEVTGLQSILDAKQKKGTEKDIIDIRIIGCVKKADLDHISSSAEGLQVKGAAKYNEMNITIEGIGEDAVVHGFGFLIRNCGNVELRNFAIMAFMDDGVSLDTANCNIWVHDLDIFYGATGGDSDQAKGDGSVDVKGKSTYITISYNRFWDSGKCSLCGMSDSEEFMVTYHHNWFDHSDSRHPRIRVGSIHVYNNYFDGNSKYGVGTTKGSSAFVEANYFKNCNYPMMSSKQGTDAMGDGTFSGEDGGMIKAYNNKIEGANRLIYANSNEGTLSANATSFDAYLASERSEKVPNTFKTVSGGTTYNNFDTDYDLGVTADAIDSPENVKDIVTAKAGRLNGGDFKRKPGYSISSDDESYAVDTTLKADVVNYKSEIVFIGGIKGVSTDPGSSSGGSTGGGSGSAGGDGSGDNNIIISGGEIYKHNFTTDGFSSDSFFTINANKQSKPTTVNYVDPNGNPLTLTQAIKMESSTKVSFTAAVSGTLIIVLVPESGKTGKTKVDGANHDPADGIIEVYFETAGAHTIEKGDKADIYYIAYVEDTYDTNDVRDPIFSIPSGNLPIGTPLTLTCETEGAEIYYTYKMDGTEPADPDKENGTLYTGPIIISKTITIKAIAIKGELKSEISSFKYTVSEDAVIIPAGVGLRVVLKYPNETYTYTGSAINPDIVVWNNNDRLVEGVDYTVKYSNNINASEGAKENKKPRITVAGKGNLTGNASTTFEIERKKLDDISKGAGIVEVGGIDNTEPGALLLAVEKTKLSPMLYYGGVKLTNKDFDVSKTDKCEQADDGKEITITGKGNFDGTLTYKLKVINKNDLKKFTVAFKAPEYTYTGMPQKFELADGDVKDSTSGTNLVKGTEYTVVYQKDTTNAGVVKFTIVGLGYYTGSVTKSYTIKPKAVTSGMEITGVSSDPYPYIGTGVTVPTAGVTYTYQDADGNAIQDVLEEGKDYKLAYSGNKKVGEAKIAVSFMGNYKGSKMDPKTFKIAANALNNDTEGLKIVVADMVYNKPGVYKSAPYVSVNGAEVKSSDYTVTYYTDENLSNEMGSKNKITEAATVYVKITGKEKGNYTGTELTTSYKVHQKASDSVWDLSKAKITVYKGWDVTEDKANKTNKMEYTGEKVEPGVMIELKQGTGKKTLKPKEVKQLMDEGKLSVQYVNNVNKGKATIVINGDGETYVGGKTAAFSITTKNLKDTDVLDDLFKAMPTGYDIRYLLQNP